MESLAAAERAVVSERVAAIADATTDFHDVVVEFAGSRLLQELTVPVQGRVKRLFHIASDRDDRDVHQEHRELCDAIVRGQVERAAALALAHIEHSRADTVPLLSGDPDRDPGRGVAG
ncbi:MAG: FCD domain-containing protein [Leucobacter sp.]